MEIIRIRHEHAMVDLDSIEIRALRIALLGAIQESKNEQWFFGHFGMTTERGRELADKLDEALEFARQNLPHN